MSVEFRKRDQEYFEWLDAHPSGFVVNTDEARSTDYPKIHLATCSTIRPGRASDKLSWTGTYFKVCSTDLAELVEWVEGYWEVPKAPSYCAVCFPDRAEN